MRDGVVREEKNLLSPSFQGPVFDVDVETFMREESQNLAAALPTRQYYRNMTVPELRDELSSRRIKPYSVGRRKDDYIDRLMFEDQRGNRHPWWYDGDIWGDADLQGLVEFVDDLSWECGCSRTMLRSAIVDQGASMTAAIFYVYLRSTVYVLRRLSTYCWSRRQDGHLRR